MPVKENAAPALPLSAYTGTFRSDVYGTATVAEKDGNLTVTFGKLPTVYYLTHFDGNDFYARCPSYQMSYYDGVTFQAGTDGSIRKMVLPMMLRPGIYETSSTFSQSFSVTFIQSVRVPGAKTTW